MCEPALFTLTSRDVDCIKPVLMHVHVSSCMRHKQNREPLIKTLLYNVTSGKKKVHVISLNSFSRMTRSDVMWPSVMYVLCIHISTGCMEDGTALGDVELPSWAKGDPQEFIRIHREVSDPRPHQACLLQLASLAYYIQERFPWDLIMFVNTSWCKCTEDALFYNLKQVSTVIVLVAVILSTTV